jgi:hypothetical protein
MMGSSNNKNGYSLSHQWFDFAIENQDKISPVHAALYFWLIELNNRLGWKEKFGLPTQYSMAAIGTTAYNTYKKTLNDLEAWGFLKIISRARNQHTSTIVALSNFNKAQSKHNRSTLVIDKLYKTIKTDGESQKVIIRGIRPEDK